MAVIVKNISKVIIRQAEPADADEIIADINQICLEGHAFITQKYTPNEAWETVLHKPDEDLQHLLLIVAVLDGKIIGSGRLFLGADSTLYRHVADLGIFVLSPYRNQNVGQKIFNFLLHWAIDRQVKKITLVAIASNLPAIRFFRKNGFVHEGRLKNHLFINGRYEDLLQMSLFIDTSSSLKKYS